MSSADEQNLEEEPIDAATLLVLAAGLVRDRLQAHPASTLAAAVGVGYVLGGGIPDIAVRLGLATAARVIGGEVLRRAVGQGSESAHVDTATQ